MEPGRCSPYDVRMADKVRVGVIGAGVIGRYHCETLALRLSGAELTAVADVDEDAARRAAAPPPRAPATPHPPAAAGGRAGPARGGRAGREAPDRLPAAV